MASIREQALAAIAIKLDAIAAYGFKRNPDRPIEAADVPIIVQLDGASRMAPVQFTGSSRYLGKVAIEIYVKATPLGPTVNAGAREVVKALLADITLGGVVVDLREVSAGATEILSEQGSGSFALAAIAFEFDYWTAETDPELPAP